ncbi:imaginal disc growth factor [Culex quinquefasciatus]|uniref:Imaginal disc growth factor n=4 Tax=Culex pipiens complex TaxID=518105 RepID=B0W7I9_CULQU|nr:imaginal disc growth factor [Culex quinquefasciatus]|eukprot:XP_001844673.1 imaginal disc growth factor [Culex quinquefasciatus]
MRLIQAGLLAVVLVAFLVHGSHGQTTPKVLCYYDGANFLIEGLAKVSLTDIEAALPFCTHLVYGYAAIDPTSNKAVSKNPTLDLDTGKSNYRLVTQLKRKFPALKVLLGVGGYRFSAPSPKYLELLESGAARITFINSVYAIVKAYEFDGIDLAWQFPQNKPKKIRGTTSKLWHGFKKVFSGDSVLDEKADEHKEEFTALLRELKNAFRADGYQLGITVLPHVNATMFMDIPAIINYLDFVNIEAVDMQTPERNPKEADYVAPLYELTDRVPGNNVDGLVKVWLGANTPPSKIVVTIPTHGRGWKMNADSGITGVPPLTADGTGPAGPQLQQEGYYTWGETCAMLPNPSNTALKGAQAPLRKVGDPTKRFGSYAFRLPDADGENGLWVSYEDPDSAGNKAAYVKAKGLGGIGINDLSYDDFRGTCAGEKFPILRAAKYRL